ncbi:uncharacterized protein LOC124896227 [Capsicum annuum]|uniref:uncharacterized protein LOC124896227 n=1 Tax=Capsicum annuum TaxID=4072 RepID=UPI001FB11DD8|nr:uncharacterized protein LOC124896227 [Capsicum annuum]
MKAYSLVKLAEKSTRLQRGQWQKLEARNNKSVLSNPTPWSQDTRNGTQNQFSNQRDLSFNGNSSVKGSRRLTRAEIDEKRAKGLCYWCDEKFNLGHNYKRRKQLFIFEVDEDWEETDVEECSEGMAVFVANGSKVYGSSVSKEVGWRMQGMDFMSDIPGWSNHLYHLEITFQILEVHNLFVKLSKCSFGEKEVKYLGHIISSDGVSANPKKLEAMVQWPSPKSMKELRGFHGFADYYRRFIQGYGVIARPLYDLLKKGSFQWFEVAETTFYSLKKVMTSPPFWLCPTSLRNSS